MTTEEELVVRYLSAAQRGDVDTLQRLFSDETPSTRWLLSASDTHGSTALHLAADNGQLAVIRFLVDRNVDVNLRDNQGMNAMHHAAKAGNLEVVKYFVSERKVPTNVKDDLGMSSLAWAASAGHLDVVEFLVSHGSDINDPDKRNKTPLLHALETSRWGVFKYLVVQGADINVVNTEGESLLHILIQMTKWDMVKHLLSVGVNVNVLNSHDKTPLQYVVEVKKWDIAKYMIKKGATLNNLNSEQKNEVLDNVVTDLNDYHNSFSNAMYLGNFELFDMLIDKFNNEYNSHNQVPLTLDNVLAKSYEELKLKNIPLSPDLEYYIENKIIQLRIFSVNNEANKEIVKSTLVDVRKRIDMVGEQIQTLNTQDFEIQDNNTDGTFLLVGRYLTQNIHILKRQLRATYSDLPWEEIEFFLVIFLSTYKKTKQFDYLYQMVIDKDVLLIYLNHFRERLNQVKTELREEDVGDKFPAKLDNNLSAHQEAESLVISKYPLFQELYMDYKLVRDIHSLIRIESYIKLALSTDLNDKSSRLVIERTLQVIGETLKNTHESPNISDELNQMLVYSAPQNVREIITLLRDSLSHSHSLKTRIHQENHWDVRYFENIKNDLRKLEFEITEILHRKKVEIVGTFLNKIIKSESLEEVKKLCSRFVGFEMESGRLGRESPGEVEKVKELLEELDKELKDETGLEGEKELLAWIKETVDSEMTRVTESASVFSYGIDAVHITTGEINHGMLSDVEAIKKIAKTLIERFNLRIGTETRQQILLSLQRITMNIEEKMEPSSKSDKIKLLLYNIKCSIEFETNRVKSIETFKSDLEGKQQFINNAALEKIKTIFNEIETNIVAKPDIKVFKEVLKNRIKKYKAKQNILSLFDNLSDGLVNKEDNQVLKKYNDLVEALEIKSTKKEELLTTFSNSDWIECKKIINNLGDKYETLVRSINNSLHNNKDIDLATTFKRFFTVKQLNKVIDKLLHRNQHQLQTYYESRLTKLKELLSVDVNSMQDNGIKLVKKYDTNKEFQAALDMLVLDMMDLLGSSSLFGDNRFSLDECSPLLLGRTLRNYLAHGDILYNIIPHRPSVSIISHAFVLITENTGLLTQKNMLIGKRVDEAFDNFHQKYMSKLNIVKNNMGMFIGAKEGDIQRVKDCTEAATDVYSRDMNDRSGLHYAAQGNDIQVFEYFLQHNLEVATRDWFGDNVLHVSAIAKHSDITKYIIEENKINVNSLAADKRTILHSRAENIDDREIVDFLIKKGAVVDVVDENLWTPLHFAAIKGHRETVISLLSWGSNVNARNQNGITPLHYAAFNGHHRVAQILLEGGALVDSRDNDDWTPLHMAALNGHIDVAKTLLNNGAAVDVRDIQDRTPLFIATFGGKLDIAIELINKGANVNSVNVREMSPLHVAAQFGQTDVIRVLLKRGARVNVVKTSEESPLHLAAVGGHLEAVQALLDHISGDGHLEQRGHPTHHDLEIDDLDEDGCTPMFLAAKRGHIEIVTLLLKNGANTEAQNNQGMSPLNISTLQGNKEVAERLLEAGASVNTQNTDGDTPLHSAAYIGEQNLVLLFLKHGMNVDVQDNEKYTPLHMAVRRGRRHVTHILLDNGANINAQSKDQLITPLHMATKFGDLDIVLDLLSRGAQVGALLVDFSSVLHVSAYYGHHKIAQALLEAGADVNALKNDNMRPLHLAAQNGYPKVAIVLLKKKPDVDAPGKDSRSALHLAAQNGHQDVVMVLLDNGAAVDIRDGLESRPLHLATEKKHEEVVSTLLTYKADVNAVNINHITPLHVAAFKGYTNIATMLLDNGAKVNALDKGHRTPLHFAANGDHKDITRILLDSQGVVDSRDNGNMTPLHMAAHFGSSGVAKVLLEHSANVNAVDDDNNTALHLAAEGGSLDVVQSLLEHGAQVNEFNNDDMTPLHRAACEGHSQIVELLLSRGAQVNALAKDNMTPLHLAAERGDKDICRMLLDSGADFLSRNTYDTVIHRAVEGDNEEVIIMILQAVRDKLTNDVHGIYNTINTYDAGYNTPLMLATREDKVNAAKMLLEFGADVDAENNEGRTALHFASEISNPELVQLLIDNNADINKRDKNGLSALNLAMETHNQAVEQEGPRLVVAQLQRAMDPRPYPQDELTLKRLLTEGKTKPYLLEPIHLAALNGKLDAVLHFLDAGTDVNMSDKKSMTPLHFAAKNGHTAIVEALINHKASVDSQNIDNWTPLMFATSNDHKDVVELLLANKAEVNIQDTMKLSPLHIASVTGHNSIVETLLHNGAIVDIVNQDNVTPLHLACEVGYKDIVDILCKHGAYIERPGKGKMRALHYAAKNGQNHVVEDLLDKGSNIEARAKDEWTALHFAATQGRGETVTLLLQRGANIHTRAKDDMRALHFAAANGRLQAVVNLLEHGADIDATAQGNTTPLTYAAANGKNNVIQVFIDRGANVNAQTVEGMTPLHYATQNGFADVVLTLLQSGAASNLKNSHQDTAEDLARKNGHFEIIQLILVLSNNQARPEELNTLTEHLAALQTEQENIGLKPVDESSHGSGCSSQGRAKRDICTDQEIDQQFPYEPLEEMTGKETTRMSKIYLHVAMAVVLEHTSHSSGTRRPTEAVSTYARNIGDIINEKSLNQSPRERRILMDHYKHVQQFFKSFPKDKILLRSRKSSYSILNTHLVPQSWLYQSGPYSLLLFYDGDNFEVFSTDLNYRHRFRARENITFQEMERFIEAFFKWRGSRHSYTTFTLDNPLLDTLLETLQDSPLWSPEEVAPDSVVMAEEHFGQIESVPAEEVRAMFYVDGHTPDMAALHPSFFQKNRGKITFRVQLLHKRISSLNVDQVQALLKLIHKYNIPADETYLQRVSPGERVLLESYGKNVIHELRTASTMSSQHLSELSWETLAEHIASYPHISEDLRERVLETTRDLHTSATRGAWAKGMATQTLFFLPDMIRAVNTGDVTNLAHIGAMLAGDATVNSLYISLINNLENVLSESRMKLLRALPVTSPVFKVLTIYSIVELTKQLQTLPPKSEMRGIIEHKLGEQYATAGLMVAELMGFEVTPLWVGLIVEQLMFDADAFRKQNHLNIPFWEALLMSLGFEQSKLHTILEERQLVQMNLVAVSRLNKQAMTPYGWVLVKHPRLEDFKWVTVSSDQVPTEVRQKISSVRSGRTLATAEDVSECDGYRLVKQYKFKTFSAHVTVVGTRGKLIRSYWQKGVYMAHPIHVRVHLSKHKNDVDSFREENNIFLDQVQADNVDYRKVPSIVGGRFLDGIDPIKRDIIGAAVYVNKQTYQNPQAQSNFYLGFDPREGNFEVNFTDEGLEKMDHINVVHNLGGGSGTMFNSFNATSAYVLTIHVGARPYPDAIEFSQQEGTLAVSDNSDRIISQYLVTSGTNYTIKDSASVTRIIFSNGASNQKDGKANLTCSTINSNANNDIEVKNWQCIKNVKNKVQKIKVKNTGYIKLSKNKKYLQMHLNDHIIDNEMKLFAQYVEILGARGGNAGAGASVITLGDEVIKFSIATRGDVVIQDGQVRLQVDGTVSSDQLAVVVSKTAHNKLATLYNVSNNDLRQIINSMTRVNMRSLTGEISCQFSTSELVYNFHNTKPTTNLLTFEGELDQRKAVFTVEKTQDTVSLLGHDNRIVHMEVKHYSQIGVLDRGLTLKNIINSEKLNSTSENDNYQSKKIRNVLYFTRPHSTFTESVLEFESLEGHLVYHQFPSSSISVNGIQYLVKKNSVCVTNGKGNTIDGREILRSISQTQQNKGAITLDICFMQSLQDSKIVVQNNSLIINGLILHHFSDKTRICFDKQVFSIRALRDSLMKRHHRTFGSGQRIKKRNTFDTYDTDTQEQENAVDLNYLLSINPPEEHNNPTFQESVDDSEEENEGSNPQETTTDTQPHATADVTTPPPFLQSEENTPPPAGSGSASRAQSSPINYIVKWIKHVSTYLTTGPGKNSQQNTWLRSDSSQTLAKTKNIQESSSLNSTVDLSLFDLNGTLTLADFVIRYFTKQKPYVTHDQPVPFLEAQCCSLNITEAFERTLMEHPYIYEDIHFNPVDIQTKVLAGILSSEFPKLPEILTTSIKYNRLHTSKDFENYLKDKIHEILEQNLSQLIIMKDPVVEPQRVTQNESYSNIIEPIINKRNLCDACQIENYSQTFLESKNLQLT